MLILFLYEAGEVELDSLGKLLRKAAGGFQDALRVGHTLEQMEADDIYSIRDEVFKAVGTTFDSRLATHYAFNIACAQEVHNCVMLYLSTVVYSSYCTCTVYECRCSNLSIIGLFCLNYLDHSPS